jgi:hypothetical protein
MANLAGPEPGPPKDPTRLRRRLLEAAVAVLAFGVWGTLAYKGGLRLLARLEGLPISGAWWIDAASLLIGLSGSIAGVSALYAVGMRIAGKTPRSFVGAPDDSPEDLPRRVQRRAGAKSLT